MNIGLMGGTFDPIHIGHLVAAEEARQQYDLGKVIFIPAGWPPHKEDELTSDPEHRYMMTVLAVTDNPSFEVSRFEIDKNKPSYTIETVRYYREIFGKDVDLFFITGADAILEIPAWAEFKELLETCTFIAASRPGYSLEKLYERLAPHYPHVRKRVHLLENPAMAVSSTFIRERVRSGKTVKYLTTGSVENYIYKYGLYRGKNIDRKVYFTS